MLRGRLFGSKIKAYANFIRRKKLTQSEIDILVQQLLAEKEERDTRGPNRYEMEPRAF